MIKRASFVVLGALYSCSCLAALTKIGYEVLPPGETFNGQLDVSSDADDLPPF